jgi:hypothetical protein
MEVTGGLRSEKGEVIMFKRTRRQFGLVKTQEKYVRKILSFFVRFTGVSFLAGLVALGVFLAYCAGQKVAIWAPAGLAQHGRSHPPPHCSLRKV